MNSFQVKISVKGTKPPVWKCCIIPGGITFSALGVLLNEMMDSDGKAPCKFEFYHRGLPAIAARRLHTASR